MSKQLYKAIEAGAEITTLRSGGQVLKHEGKSTRIADPFGRLTRLGKVFFERTGKEANTGAYDIRRELLREGPREYVVLRDGKTKKLARTWSPSGNFRYTKLGRQWFGRRKETTEMVVGIPVTVRGRNKKSNAEYTRQGMLPHSALPGLGQLRVGTDLTREEQEKQAKDQVMAAIDNTEALIEVSEETYELRGGTWRISRLTTKVAEDGDIVTEAVLNRPLSDGKPYSLSTLWHPEGLHPCCYDETDNCVPHQVSILLGFEEAWLT